MLSTLHVLSTLHEVGTITISVLEMRTQVWGGGVNGLSSHSWSMEMMPGSLAPECALLTIMLYGLPLCPSLGNE